MVHEKRFLRLSDTLFCVDKETKSIENIVRILREIPSKEIFLSYTINPLMEKEGEEDKVKVFIGEKDGDIYIRPLWKIDSVEVEKVDGLSIEKGENYMVIKFPQMFKPIKIYYEPKN